MATVGPQQGRRLLDKRWFRWTLALTLSLAIPAYFLGYHVGGHSLCSGCKSVRHYDRFGFGNPRGGWEIARWSWVSESVCREFLFDADHRHRWAAGQFHICSRKWGITCASGNMRHNGFGLLYEGNREFREFVDDRIRNGVLDRGLARALVEFPTSGAPWPVEGAGQGPSPEEIARTMEAGRELIAAYCETHQGEEGKGHFP